jgi:hypothetical protein
MLINTRATGCGQQTHITFTIAPQPARQSRPVPEIMHCEMVSKSSSGSMSLRQKDSHAPNSDSVLLPATTKSADGALCHAWVENQPHPPPTP